MSKGHAGIFFAFFRNSLGSYCCLSYICDIKIISNLNNYLLWKQKKETTQD